MNSVYSQYLALIRLVDDPETLRSLRVQAWDHANTKPSELSGSQTAMILQTATQKIELLEKDSKKQERCAQCGLPWDDHPYSTELDDLICTDICPPQYHKDDPPEMNA